MDDNPFAELAVTDRIIHEPGRLAVLSALSACAGADFVFLQRVTGLSRGNLSAHLTTLDKNGIVTITKGFNGKRPRTWVELTASGQRAVTDYWRRMDRLRRAVADWRTDN